MKPPNQGLASRSAGLRAVRAPIPTSPAIGVPIYVNCRNRSLFQVDASPAFQERRGESQTYPQPSKLEVSQDQARVTKQEHVLTLLSRPDGASIGEIMHATDWQQHSVRGFLAGTVKKKLGFTLTSSKELGEARRYRIATRRSR